MASLSGRGPSSPRANATTVQVPGTNSRPNVTSLRSDTRPRGSSQGNIPRILHATIWRRPRAVSDQIRHHDTAIAGSTDRRTADDRAPAVRIDADRRLWIAQDR